MICHGWEVKHENNAAESHRFPHRQVDAAQEQVENVMSVGEDLIEEGWLGGKAVLIGAYLNPRL